MIKKIISITLIISLKAASLYAVGSGAYTDQIVGTKAFGRGNTFVATADDSSAIYFNPAGLTQLDHPEISIGLAPILADTKYTHSSGASDEMEDFTPVVPNLYFSTPFRENWAFGIGVNSPFGLETHWGNNSPLRYVATDSYLELVNINPTAAFRWNDHISLGFGVVYGLAKATLRSRLNQTVINTVLNVAPTLSDDGGKKLQGDGDGWGYDIGILYRPSSLHSFGASYRSEIKAHLEGSAQLSGLNGTAQLLFGGDTYETNAETDVTFPETAILGYAFKPGKWTFEVNGEWANYSTVDETNLTFTNETDPTRLSVLNTGNPINRDWHTTWNLGIGLNYAINDTWEARCGYFHYPRVIPTATWDPGLPENSRNGYTIGGSFNKPNFSIDAAYNFIAFNDRTVTNTIGATSLSSVNGTYETTAHIFSANVTYRFLRT